MKTAAELFVLYASTLLGREVEYLLKVSPVWAKPSRRRGKLWRMLRTL